MRIQYLGKKPILIGHKLAYRGEQHEVAPVVFEMLKAQYGESAFRALSPTETPAKGKKKAKKDDEHTALAG